MMELSWSGRFTSKVGTKNVGIALTELNVFGLDKVANKVIARVNVSRFSRDSRAGS